MNEVEKEPDKKSLMTMVSEYQWLSQTLVASGGEITPELEQWFSKIVDQIGDKAKAYKFIMDAFARDEEFWKQQAEPLLRNAKSCKRMREMMNTTMKHAMLSMGMTELQSDTMNVKIVNGSPTVEIIDQAVIPRQFIDQVVTEVVNTDAIKACLKDGIDVPGVRLNEVKSLRFYVKK